MKTSFFLATIAALLATPALAQDSNLRFGVGVSTLGGNLEAAYRLNERFAVRGVLSSIGTNRNETIDGNNFNLNATLGGFSLLGDYYTGRSGFRISAGAFVSRTSFTATSTASATNPITVGGATLTGGETIRATAEFANRVSPMLTIGYDQKIGRSFTLSGEIGAIAMGGISATLTAPGVAAADIATEINDIQNASPNLYPYVAITGSFRF